MVTPMGKSFLKLFGAALLLFAVVFLATFAYYLSHPDKPSLQDWCKRAGGMTVDTYCFMPVEKD